MRKFRSHLVILGLVASVSIAAAHKFYFSRTLIHHNFQSGTLEIEMKLFTDDLERAVRTNSDTEIRLGVDSTYYEAERLVGKYIEPRFNISVNNLPLSVRYLGMEVENDITYCFLETTPNDAIHSIEIENLVFFEIFDDQINELDLRMQGWTRREQVTYKNPKVLILP